MFGKHIITAEADCYDSEMTRRSFATTLALIVPLKAASAAPRIEVYKTPTCGCCGKWVSHMQQHGFEVTVHEVESTAAYRRQARVPDKLASCHTGIVEGYGVEGHVPAEEVLRLLKERPGKVKGLAVPGMPLGSPGMEQGARRAAYDVLAFTESGEPTVFKHYDAKQA